MFRRAASSLVILAALAACNKDDAPEAVPVQQSSAADSSKAPATNPAPAPARPAPSPSAAEIAANAAGTELANTRMIRTIQVAALPNSATAEWWVNELKRQGIPAYSVHTIVNGAEVTRLRIGAATNGSEARALADRIHAQFKWPVWITTVEDRTLISGEMLTASRAYAAR